MVKILVGSNINKQPETKENSEMSTSALNVTITPASKPAGTVVVQQQQQNQNAPTEREPSKRDIAREARQELRAELAAMIEDNPHVEFTYVRPYDEDDGEVIPNGGACIAWVRDAQTKGKEYRDRDTILHVSIAWCSDRDVFDKTVGKHIAMTEFLAGRRTRIRLNHAGEYSEQLKEIFSICV